MACEIGPTELMGIKEIILQHINTQIKHLEKIIHMLRVCIAIAVLRENEWCFFPPEKCSFGDLQMFAP